MTTATSLDNDIKVADEVFIATALLHREQPDRAEFTISEIVARVERERLSAKLRPGVRVHASQHCVANRRPNPGRYRMLYATGANTRRLFAANDAAYPGRDGKIFPSPDDVPARYHDLIDWAKERYAADPATPKRWLGELIAFRGMGKKYASIETPDEYVSRLREEWD